MTLRPPLTGWRLAQVAPLAATVPTDDLARESRTASPFGATITIRCQEADEARRRSRGPGGEDLSYRRTELVRQADCLDLSWSPQVGDLWLATLDRYGNTIDATRLYIAAVRRIGFGPIRDAFYALDLVDEAPGRRVA